jgi:hypothetical protein
MALRVDDTFATGSDQVVSTYDANYTSMNSQMGGTGSGTLTVRTATSRVEPTNTSAYQTYMANHSGLPTTGTYTVLGRFYGITGGSPRYGVVAYASGTGASANYYAIWVDTNNVAYLARVTNGSRTDISSLGAVPTNSEFDIEVTVSTPDGSTSRIAWDINGGSITGSYDDTSGSRKTSGLPGFFLDIGYNDSVTKQYMTTFQVDDPLYSGAGAATQWRNVTTATKAARYEALR